MRVTTAAVTFASQELTIWPVEGQIGQEIEVNNIVNIKQGSAFCTQCGMLNPCIVKHVI